VTVSVGNRAIKGPWKFNFKIY